MPGGAVTVDWSRWMELSDAEKRALWAQYRQIVSDEAAQARFNNYRRLDEALFGRRGS